MELLIATTEKLSGLRPEVSDIELFLKRFLDRSSAPQATAAIPPVRRARVLTASASVPNGQDFINRKIESFVLFGTQHSVGKWQELLLIVAGELYRRHSRDFDRCLSLRGTKMLYFSKDPNELKDPRQIADSIYYAETKLNSNSIVGRSLDLLEVFDHGDQELQISAR